MATRDDHIPAGKYELTALLWDEITSEPGKPFTFVRHRQGEVVDLNEEDARRLVLAGAAVEPGSIERARVAALRAEYEAALAALPPEPEDDDAADEEVDESALPEHLKGLKVKDLRAYAGTQEIDLKGASKKADILTAILEAESV